MSRSKEVWRRYISVCKFYTSELRYRLNVRTSKYPKAAYSETTVLETKSIGIQHKGLTMCVYYLASFVSRILCLQGDVLTLISSILGSLHSLTGPDCLIIRLLQKPLYLWYSLQSCQCFLLILLDSSVKI